MASAGVVTSGSAISAPRRRYVIVNAQLTIGLIVLAVLAALAIVLPLFIAPQAVSFLPTDQAPSLAHPMGLGTHSQDIFSEWVYAARYSLTVGLLAGLGSTLLSILIGVTAGYLGGWIDDVLSFVIRVVLLVPPIPALLVVGFGLGIQGLGRLILLLTFMTWAYGADVLRGQTMTLRQREFMVAAISTGEGPLQAMVREIVPHLRGLILFVLVSATLFALQAEFALEFLGWDALAGVTTIGGGWGVMMYNAYYDMDFLAGVWWTWVFPGLGIMLTTAALALVSAGLSDQESA